MRASFLVCSLLASTSYVATASAGTLLIDMTGDSASAVASTSADFAVADSAVELAASVNAVDTAALTAVSGVGIDANVEVLVGTNFNATGGPRDGQAIFDGYIYGSFTNPSLEITGLEEIAAGTQVLVTVYSLGDNDNQTATQEITYNGVTTSAPSSSSVSEPFEQFTFTKVDSVDSLIVTAVADTRFSAINAVSLTFVPEPSSLALLGLGGLLVARRRR